LPNAATERLPKVCCQRVPLGNIFIISYIPNGLYVFPRSLIFWKEQIPPNFLSFPFSILQVLLACYLILDAQKQSEEADFGKESMAARGRLSIYCCRTLASLT